MKILDPELLLQNIGEAKEVELMELKSGKILAVDGMEPGLCEAFSLFDQFMSKDLDEARQTITLDQLAQIAEHLSTMEDLLCGNAQSAPRYSSISIRLAKVRSKRRVI